MTARPFGTAVITIYVDGGEFVVRTATARVRDSIKSGDPVRVEGRKIIVELNDRNSAEAASQIARRLRESLEDLDVEIEIDD